MDVLSSDLYSDYQSSDDSLPDISSAFGVKSTYNRKNESVSSNRQMGPSAAQTLSRNSRHQENNSDSLAGIRQMMEGRNSSPKQSQRDPFNSTRVANRAPSSTQFNFDPISSSNPPSAALAPTYRSKSFNAPERLPSSSPLAAKPPIRAPIHRANTFPRANSPNPPPIYHVISDDEDGDLKAAIAASLADMDTQPTPATTRPSVFYDPSELWDSSPPEAATQVIPTTNLVPSKPSRSPTPSSAQPLEPPSSQTSSHIRDDMRRLLSALDDLTTNHLKRKNEETPPPTKKPGTENTDQPKPKRGRLTQEEKVSSHSAELTAGRPRHISSRKSRRERIKTS